MSDADLLSFDMGKWLAPNGILFMWATSPRLDFALKCIDAWRLTYRGMGFVWIKTKLDGTPIGAQGVRPSIIKPLSEFVLCASRIKTGRPMKLADESISQLIFAPKQEHSRKPDEVAKRIELLYPNVRRIELFARRPMVGWDSWGNELPISN